MNPTTRPLGDNFPEVKIETASGGSTSSRVDTRVNDSLPWIVVTAILGSLGLGLSIAAILLYMSFSSRVNVAENHWRNDEVELLALKARIEYLEKHHAGN